MRKKHAAMISGVIVNILASALAGILSSVPVYAHQGLHNANASLACEEKALSEICEWSDPHDARYRGTCRKISNSLLCVRNKPIIYPPE